MSEDDDFFMDENKQIIGDEQLTYIRDQHGRPVITVAYRVVQDRETETFRVQVGASFCSTIDQPAKRLGKQIAQSRLVKNPAWRNIAKSEINDPVRLRKRAVEAAVDRSVLPDEPLQPKWAGQCARGIKLYRREGRGVAKTIAMRQCSITFDSSIDPATSQSFVATLTALIEQERNRLS